MRPPGPSACLAIQAFSYDLDDGEESPQLELDLPSPDPTPDELLQLKQEKARVQGFVRTLTTTDQDVVRRRYWGEQSQADIARALKVSEAAISKRLRKVVTLGRSCLADLEIVN